MPSRPFCRSNRTGSWNAVTSSQALRWWIHHRKACDEVTAFQDPVRFERQKGRDGIAFNGLDAPYYEIANRLGEAVPRESGLRTSSLRGIAHLTNIFAIESFMDELARKRGIDPATFRRDLVKTNPRATHIIDTVKRDGS